MTAAINNNNTNYAITPYIYKDDNKIYKDFSVIWNISRHGFDFKIFNLDVDRYIIDSTDISSQDSYLVFQNYRFNT